MDKMACDDRDVSAENLLNPAKTKAISRAEWHWQYS